MWNTAEESAGIHIWKGVSALTKNTLETMELKMHSDDDEVILLQDGEKIVISFCLIEQLKGDENSSLVAFP